MPGAPTPDDVRAIAALDDGAIRNLEITEAYGRLSTALVDLLGPGANWCTFATWASRQAGQTIREEDARRAVERMLDSSPELGEALGGVAERLLRRSGALADHSRLAIVRALSPAARLDAASAAVARGNRKVFEEVGEEFARFLATFGEPGALVESNLDRFLDALRPGPSPHGQQHLRDAFGCYYRAALERDAKARAELLLRGNLLVGLHEQTRLQPEIAEALDAVVVDAAEVRRAVLQELFERGGLSRWSYHLYLRWTRSVGERWERLTRVAQHLARRATTELLMTIELPHEVVRLGRDLVAAYPATLREIASPELAALLASVDPGPDGGRGSGAEDWADLGQRMHLITELFRSHQEDPSLFDPPFAPGEREALEAELAR